MKENKFSFKKNVLIIVVAAVLVLGIGGAALVIAISNSPENRVSRYMGAAERYMEEMNYEQAVIEYQRVLEIDPMNVDAYLGLSDAYIGLGDIDMAIDTLETGLGKVLGNTEIEQKLKELYFGVIEDKKKVSDYEAELGIFDRLLEFASEDGQVIDELCECLKAYIAVLMDKEMYDEIRVLAEKYGSVATDVDFESILAEIQQIEKYGAIVMDTLTDIAAFCKEEKYDDVFEFMQLEKYETLLAEIDKIEDIKDINRVETEYGEIGIYRVDHEYSYGGYMIYYGDFEGDERQGSGIWIGCYDDNKYVAKGTWKADFPQGEFTVRYYYVGMQGAYIVMSGNVDDGLWNGEVLNQWQYEDGMIETYTSSFKNGKYVPLRQDGDDWVVGENEDKNHAWVLNDEQFNLKCCGIADFAEDSMW